MRRIGIISITLVCLVGLFWVPFDPMDQAFRADRLAGPSWPHICGIDGVGRDFFSRLWRGLSNSVVMGIGGVCLSLIFSISLLVLEMRGTAWQRNLILIAISIWLGIPVVMMGLLLLLLLQPSATTLVLAAGLGNVPFAYRQMRVAWREVREAMYVQASEALGANRWGLFRRTLWPNLKPDFWGLCKLLLAMSMLEISGLAYLGLVGDPDFPELGSILRQNQTYLRQAPQLILLPGLLLSGFLAWVHSTK